MRGRHWLALATVLVVVTACGDDEDDQTTAAAEPPTASTAAPVDENDRAERVLPTTADFPPGWSEAAVRPDRADCFDAVLEADDVTGLARSGNWNTGDNYPLVAGVAVVYPTAEAAQSAFLTATGDEPYDCYLKAIDETIADDPNTEVAGSSVRELSYGTIGDESMAHRLSVDVQAGEQTIPLTSDVVVSRTGRFLVLMLAADAPTPFDEALGLGLLTAMADRAAAEQG